MFFFNIFSLNSTINKKRANQCQSMLVKNNLSITYVKKIKTEIFHPNLRNFANNVTNSFVNFFDQNSLELSKKETLPALMQKIRIS